MVRSGRPPPRADASRPAAVGVKLQPGTQVTDRVRLVAFLAEGRMGQVWLGHHETLDAEVAVKFIAAGALAHHPNAGARFSVEAGAAARIQTPHVVRIFDHGEMADGTAFIVMERLHGHDLQALLELEGPCSLRDTYQVLRQIGRALDAARASGVVHRDVKPHNIFLVDGPELFAKLVDFGSARSVASDARLTRPGVLVGTPAYVSRDLFENPLAVDHRADLWALGVTAYKMLTGALPFGGETLGEVRDAVCNGVFPRPSRLRPELTEAHDDWFAGVFHPDPGKRPASGAAMARSFKALAPAAVRSTFPPPMPAATATEEVAPVHRPVVVHRRAPLVLLGLGVAGGAAALVWATLPSAPREPAASAAVASPSAIAPPASTASSASLLPPVVEDSADDDAAATVARAEDAESPPGPADDAGEPFAETIPVVAPPASTSEPMPPAPAALRRELAERRVPVPEGPFWMGCDEPDDRDCTPAERPGRAVHLEAFTIDRYEVSMALYRSCVDAGVCNADGLHGVQTADGFTPSEGCHWGKADHLPHPVNCVDHHQATRFCHWAGGALPTEAQWEKAARGIDRRRLPWQGEGAACTFAVMGKGPNGCRAFGTWPVSSKSRGASPYGAYNLAGNVAEWTADWFDPDYYAVAPAREPTGPERGSERVVRGGSWAVEHETLLRTSRREAAAPEVRAEHIGFRCVARVEPG